MINIYSYSMDPLSIYYYLAFAFIVVICIIALSDTPRNAMVVVGCLAYILIMSANMVNLHKSIHLSVENEGVKAPATMQPVGSVGAQSATPGDITADDEIPPNQADFNTYDNYDSFRRTYTDSYDKPNPRSAFDGSEKTYGIDSANALMAQRRFRDKRAMSGWAIKSADFYKYHYGDELDKAESRIWWQEADY